MKMVEKFQISNSLAGLDTLRVNLERIGLAWGLSEKQLFEVNFLIEEICANCIEHTEPDAIDFIGLSLSLENATLLITITDHGPQFDPTKTTDPDVHLPAEKRKVGGLGLYLVKHFADKISYARTDNTNTVYIEKQIKKMKNKGWSGI